MSWPQLPQRRGTLVESHDSHPKLYLFHMTV